MSRVACGGRYISNVSKDLGRDEYIDQRHRGWRLTGTGFGAHFTRIDNTEYIAGAVLITEMLSIKIALNFPLKAREKARQFSHANLLQ
jgi:hypothetical protein